MDASARKFSNGWQRIDHASRPGGPTLLERSRTVTECVQTPELHDAWCCRAVDGCEALGAIVAALIKGMPLTDALNRNQGTFCDGVQRVVDGSWKGKPRSDIRSSGYVIHTLEAAMWCLSETTTFREAVLLAVNLGEDADTVGAVTGQIAGATYGLSAIPEKWVSRLAWNEKLIEVGTQLIDPPSGQRL